MAQYEKLNEKQIISADENCTFVIVKDGAVLRASAKDIIQLLGGKKNYVDVTLPAAGWSEAAPYTQRVAVPGIKSTDSVTINTCTPIEIGVEETKLRKKLTSMITDGDSEDGYMTFYCIEKKPTSDFVVSLGGVSVDG